MLWCCRCPNAPRKGGFPLSCLPAGPFAILEGSVPKKNARKTWNRPPFFPQNIYLIRRCCFFPDLQRNLLFNRWPWWNSSQKNPSDLVLSFFRMLCRSFGIHCVCFLRFQDIHLHLRRNDVQLWHDLPRPPKKNRPPSCRKKNIKKRMKVPSKCCEWEWSWRNLGECSFFKISCCIAKCRNLLTGWLSLRLFPLIFALQNLILWGKVPSFVAIHTANLVSLEIKHEY